MMKNDETEDMVKPLAGYGTVKRIIRILRQGRARPIDFCARSRVMRIAIDILRFNISFFIHAYETHNLYVRPHNFPS